MGGSTSQPVAAGEQEAVFSLSAGLQERMAEEFNNEQIAKVFGKQMEKLGERKAETIKASVQQRTELEERLGKFREQNNQVQAQLDQKIEAIEDRFTDMANVVEYDVTRLDKQYLGGKKQNSQIACLAERVNVATCYKDSGNCDSFIEALSQCASESITSN
mmetsp:Transcript_113816/g.170238  ORF Transcript_113816/g.170238 Transcript_113816/m.170238 type:complete len:161 (-) Transcript_113816:27-509(-)|eukprot:CAMPEP_0117008092 /NCGR_PEP_ID=MMETSP0472-20121206/7734_1 /TAXON_ID=693140 ORGANISM="Tiarina fusus, Strain LIS" /NCGR_SAMPLE_ID=MMETSP0472 /ASSEMBLY_ACC=CAM_ASM_000603 /LENGTH=160 /DNA_ID=CAMNT_0004710039 /DNA_START=81 /DNA_END=563 /DNA_ORIENTATION=+